MKRTPEQQVLFALLSGNIQEIPEDFNADRFWRLLKRHKLQQLSEKILPLVSDEVQKGYKEELRHWGAMSLLFFQELKNVNALLQKSDIQMVVLKGPVLSYQVYHTFHHRYYSDLDILIHPGQLEKAALLLQEAGYVAPDGSSPSSIIQREDHLEYNNDFVVRNPATGIVLEVHVGIYVAELLDREGERAFMQRASDIEISGHHFRVFSSEFNLVYICFHAAKHMFFRILWLSDIDGYIREVAHDPERVIGLARELKMDKMLFISLALVRTYFQTPLPEEYRRFLSRHRHPVLLWCARGILLGPGILVYESGDVNQAKKGKEKGIDQVKPVHYFWQLLFLVLLRRGIIRQARFLFYQFRKRILR